jgi:hypothetical protein
LIMNALLADITLDSCVTSFTFFIDPINYTNVYYDHQDSINIPLPSAAQQLVGMRVATLS